MARARSLALWDAEMMKPKDDIIGQFTQAIVRDLLAGRRVGGCGDRLGGDQSATATLASRGKLTSL